MFFLNGIGQYNLYIFHCYIKPSAGGFTLETQTSDQTFLIRKILMLPYIYIRIPINSGLGTHYSYLLNISLRSYFRLSKLTHTKRGHVAAQLVEALCYKPESCGFDSRWWNFSLT